MPQRRAASLGAAGPVSTRGREPSRPAHLAARLRLTGRFTADEPEPGSGHSGPGTELSLALVSGRLSGPDSPPTPGRRQNKPRLTGRRGLAAPDKSPRSVASGSRPRPAGRARGVPRRVRGAGERPSHCSEGWGGSPRRKPLPRGRRAPVTPSRDVISRRPSLLLWRPRHPSVPQNFP